MNDHDVTSQDEVDIEKLIDEVSRYRKIYRKITSYRKINLYVYQKIKNDLDYF
jgi:hypothetical protein